MIQHLLPLSDPDRDFCAGVKVRESCRIVADELGHKVVAKLWGCHESTVQLKIEERNRNFIHPHEMLALKRADQRGLIAAAEEAVLHPPVSESEILARYPIAIRRYVTEEIAQLIERDAGHQR